MAWKRTVSYWRQSLVQPESVLESVTRVNDKLVKACEVGRATDFGYAALARADSGWLHNSGCKLCADDAFVYKFLVQLQVTLGKKRGNTG